MSEISNLIKSSALSALIPANVEPIGHIPPLPPIDIAPRAKITKAPALEYWEQDLERVAERARLERGDRIWKLVRQTAEGTNMPTRSSMPLGDSETGAGALNAPEASGTAVDDENASVTIYTIPAPSFVVPGVSGSALAQGRDLALSLPRLLDARAAAERGGEGAGRGFEGGAGQWAGGGDG